MNKNATRDDVYPEGLESIANTLSMSDHGELHVPLQL
jgi:hypothetical protein